jgi:hypothetical protein
MLARYGRLEVLLFKTSFQLLWVDLRRCKEEQYQEPGLTAQAMVHLNQLAIGSLSFLCELRYSGTTASKARSVLVQPE